MHEPKRKTKLPRISAAHAAPGVESADLQGQTLGGKPAKISCIDYSPEQIYVHDIKDLDVFIAHHRPSWSAVRWINIEGLSQPEVIRAFAEKYQLHPLAVEDLLRGDQRPKVEDFPGQVDNPGRLFLVARMVSLEGEKVGAGQVSMFLGRRTLLTFSENEWGLFEPIRQRIKIKGSRLRDDDASFLLHALLDAIVDRFFPVLENVSERLESIEEAVLMQPEQSHLQQIHDIKRELVLLRRSAWPTRDLIANLLRERHECLSEAARTYFRDVYDHCTQIIDLIETYREIGAAVTETYMTTQANRLNQVMKVLTVIGTIFIPLTFLAGVYGMNMPIPENQWEGSYVAFWIFSVATAGGMLYWFRRNGWI